MQSDEYITIRSYSEAQIERHRSRFLAKLYPIGQAADSRKILSQLKVEFTTANHFVWAYRLFGIREKLEACSDAGEPKGSAGLPLLNTLKKAKLFNVFIVVLRWFGGQKLGIPGLIEAYSSAATIAIKNAEIYKTFVEKELLLELPYDKFGKLKSLVAKGDARIISSQFKEKVSLKLGVRESKWKEFQVCVKNITG